MRNDANKPGYIISQPVGTVRNPEPHNNPLGAAHLVQFPIFAVRNLPAPVREGIAAAGRYSLLGLVQVLRVDGTWTNERPEDVTLDNPAPLFDPNHAAERIAQEAKERRDRRRANVKTLTESLERIRSLIEEEDA
jgi:hypothetical protein